MAEKSTAETEGCLVLVCVTIIAISVGHLFEAVYGWLALASLLLIALVAEKRGWL